MPASCRAPPPAVRRRRAAFDGNAAAEPGRILPLLAADAGLAERARNASGVPEPVHLAVALGRARAVALLASLGFPIDEDRCGWGPPPRTAALTGQLDIVRLLVELGADPTAEAPDGADPPAEPVPHDRTPLGWARYHHHEEVIAYLAGLSRGAGSPG